MSRYGSTGGDPAGAFYGTRTVLQLLHQASTIPAGTAVDWPSYSERGLMVDVGRKFFTVDWLCRHVRELSYLKLNYLHRALHQTEHPRSHLLRRAIPRFDAPYWHIGADEYLRDYARYPQLLAYAKEHYGKHTVAKDAYHGFINWVSGIRRSAGKTTRMWNDGIENDDGTISLATETSL